MALCVFLVDRKQGGQTATEIDIKGKKTVPWHYLCPASDLEGHDIKILICFRTSSRACLKKITAKFATNDSRAENCFEINPDRLFFMIHRYVSYADCPVLCALSDTKLLSSWKSKTYCCVIHSVDSTDGSWTSSPLLWLLGVAVVARWAGAMSRLLEPH